MAFTWVGKSQDGQSVTLKKLNVKDFKFPSYFNSDWEAKNKDKVKIGCTIDVETTGLSSESDSVIEVGICKFKFNTTTGEVLTIIEELSALQDPGRPLSDEITILTGITDDMVYDQAIDWSAVDMILKDCDVIIAHNAKFDRPFIDQKSEVSSKKLWACSCQQIDWFTKGLTSAKLELLNIYHGFFVDSHRALEDATALLYLLSFNDKTTSKTYLSEMIDNTKKQFTKVYAKGAPFEGKDQLKARRYNWDNTGRVWHKTITEDKLDEEVQWLEKNVYKGNFVGSAITIPLTANFK
ncbi:MAG: DNA polymerase III subunit epsilon [Bdellovibrionaceae bacterium]|nr:DNA polymerase III subunit epsilon [Pseudobdellovibrionaceae bacterium]